MTVAEEQLRVMIISLAQAANRQRLMTAQLDWPGMPEYEFLDAVDGRLLDAEKRDSLYDEAAAIDYKRALTAPEIGCAESHLMAYRRILEHDLPAALILEDDALLGHQFSQVLERLLPILEPDHPQVILLSHISRYSAWGGLRLDKLHRLYRPYRAYGAHAYLITRAGAQAMLEIMQPIHTVADDWIHVMRSGRVTLRAVVPYPVGTMPAAKDSQIGNERFMSAKKGSSLTRWIHKYLWMKLLFQLVGKPVLRLKRQDSSW
ncbi:MAG: glycosyltransferase family 25 protein [Candidatus Thiodiazotropha sp.]|jgi:glycosyl transferase family 25